MNLNKRKWLALLGGALLLAGPTMGQDNQAILDILVRKGIITQAEAAAVQAEAQKTAKPAVKAVEIRTKPVSRLQLSGRMQLQFDGISTDRSGADNPATSHFFVRRAYLVTSAQLGEYWTGNITYDMSGSFFDAFNLQYKGWAGQNLTLGIRKVNFGLEENVSSGSLKSIERTGVTRYFVESNNGRRLGAGSYRTGLFLDGSEGSFFWGAAITNPERVGSNSNSVGNGLNNNQAYWGNIGVRGKFDGGDYRLGLNVGILPDQGGKTLGTGDLMVYSLNATINSGNFSLLAEYLMSDNENGAALGRDAKSAGFWIQPSYKFNDKFEGVVRFSHLDTDGRGVDLSDGVRSAPGGGMMDKLTDYYVGGTYYLIGNDLKFQTGFVYGQTKNTVAGASAESTSYGLRSQVQLNF